MNRDPSEFRRLYREWITKTDEYNAMIESIINGTAVSEIDRDRHVQQLRSAYEAFMAESRHFVHWK